MDNGYIVMAMENGANYTIDASDILTPSDVFDLHMHLLDKTWYDREMCRAFWIVGMRHIGLELHGPRF